MRKGLYEIFTTLFFIIIILVSLFVWLSVSGTINIIKAEEGNQRLAITSARETYSQISRCSIMNETRLEECINQDFDFVKGISVNILPVANCTPKTYGELAGDNQFPYYINVQQQKNICIAQMVIGI